MKRIFLSLAALCCIVASSLAAAGDKIYFVNNAGLTGNIYVGEANESWGWVTGSNAVYEERQYDGKDIYSYTITNADATRLYLTNTAYGNGATWIQCGTDARYTAGCYYLIETNGTNYWLTQKYYNEFYFMDNNENAIMGETPAIVLYNVVGDWTSNTILNGERATALMSSIGTVAKGENTFAGYKYATMTDQACTHVEFVNPTTTSITTQAKPVDAEKNIYAWGEWYNELPKVADKIYLRYATDADANTWAEEVEMPLNGEWRYTASISNFVVTEEGDYKFRAFLGSGSWAAPVTHPNAANWHESVHLTPGIYNLYYLYNPYDGTFSVTPSKQYNRTGLTANNFGTICLPYASTYWEGDATFYTIAGKEGDNIVLEEVSNSWLQAGRPYIFQASDTWLTVWFNDEAAVDAPLTTNTNGLVGSFTEQALADNAANLYVLSNNAFHPVGENVKVGANRAYLDMSAVSAAPAQAPGKRYVRVAVQGKMPTALENVQEAAQSTKVIENGVLYIIKNGVRYNAQGQIVK